MKEIPYSRARGRMEALMDQVADDREPIVIRRRGKDPVALIAADDLESLTERHICYASRQTLFDC